MSAVAIPTAKDMIRGMSLEERDLARLASELPDTSDVREAVRRFLGSNRAGVET